LAAGGADPAGVVAAGPLAAGVVAPGPVGAFEADGPHAATIRTNTAANAAIVHRLFPIDSSSTNPLALRSIADDWQML
jgi:hypothetical protein